MFQVIYFIILDLIYAKKEDSYNIPDDQKEKISTLYSKRADYLNLVAVNMMRVKNKSYNIKDLLDFFQKVESLNYLKERFGEENIPQFINDEDGVCLQFKKIKIL